MSLLHRYRGLGGYGHKGEAIGDLSLTGLVGVSPLRVVVDRASVGPHVSVCGVLSNAHLQEGQPH